MNTKNPLLAFFLSFIPGVGHFYMNRKIRGFFYGAFGMGPVAIGLFISLVDGYPQPFFLGVGLGIIVTVLNMFDMAIFLLKKQRSVQTSEGQKESISEHQIQSNSNEVDRFYVITLSFIPGLGHFQLGLMNRGLTFLIGFFGLGMMVIFISAFTNQGSFMVFLGILPILWIYSMFDAIQQVTKKQRGEELVDRTILEDFEETRHEKGKKSKTLATVLSIFPGAGHLYLGLQKRGIQLMAAFLFSIYILDVLRLSLFLFLIPIIWFYSFFDALQKVSKHGEEELEDVPVISYFINHQKWLGIGLLALGLYYIFDGVLLPALSESVQRYYHINLYEIYHTYFQNTIICLLLIGGGLKLIFGSKRKRERESA